MQTIGYCISFLFVFTYIVIALLNTTVFQSFLASKLSEYFSSQWNTKVRIGSINVNIFDRVALHDVYLEDLHHDTILAADNILVRLKALPSISGIKIDEVLVQNTTFNLKIENEEISFAFIIKYFSKSPPTPPNTNNKPFVVDVSRCKLENVNFALILADNKEFYPKRCVAINNMRYSNINADIRNIKVINDSIRAKFINFSTKERSGLEVKKLAGEFIVSSSGISAKNTELQTSNSRLLFDASMKTTYWGTYSSFIDSVYLEGEIKKGSVGSVRDATYWADVIHGFNQRAELNAHFKGTISELYCDNIELRTGNNTYVRGYGSIIGLPNPDNTYYNLFASDIYTSYADYKAMELGELLENIPIPEMVNKLGMIKMKGAFSGLIESFEAIAEIESEIGNLKIKGKSAPQTSGTKYVAELSTDLFDIGTLLDNNLITTTALNAYAEVSGSTMDNLYCKLDTKISNLIANNNLYDSINIKGEMINKDISSYLEIFDDALKLKADVGLRLDEKIQLNLYAQINDANLHKTNFFSFADTNTIFSTKIEANLSDLDINSATGYIKLNNLKFNLEDKDIGIDYLNIFLDKSDIRNDININSDKLDLYLSGHFTIAQLANDFNFLIKKYVPKFDFSNKEHITKETFFENLDSEFNFSSTIKDASPFLTLFAPDIELSKNATLYGNYSKDNKFNLSFIAKQLKIAGVSLDNINLNLETKDTNLITNLKCTDLTLTDSLFLKNVSLDIMSDSSQLNMVLNFDDKLTTNQSKGHLNFNGFVTQESFQGSFEKSEFQILGNKTLINNNHIISYNGEKISLLNFSLNKKGEDITINGIISDNPNDKLNIEFNNVDISSFNPIIKSTGFSLGGRLNDKVELRGIMDNLSFNSNVRIDSLVINNNLLGDGIFKINNTFIKDELYTDVQILYKDKMSTIYPLSLKGYIRPNKNKNNLDLSVNLQNLNINIVEPFLSSFSSDFSGTISGKDIKITGNFNQPNIKGKLICKDGKIKIDMINTYYLFNDTVSINNNLFSFNNFTLKDINNNYLIINGNIKHINFQEFDINLNAKADKLKILNTTATSNQMYYGTAYVSAIANLKGNLNFLNIDVIAKTEKGTKLYIPISSKVSVNQNSYIQFVTPRNDIANNEILINTNTPSQEIEYKIKVNLSVTPDAIIELPMNFTQLTGDLSASGVGELKIDIDQKGTFNMFGNVEIDNGLFKMSLMNIIEKTFILEKGGSIEFNGSPTDAILNAQAIYKTKASLAPILGVDYSKPVDVQSVISLSGNMMNPIPKFDIKLPNTDPTTIDALFMNIDKNDEKAMLEQTISLLLTRQFYPSQGGFDNNIIGNSLTNSAFEVAFGQISGMLTDMVKFVNIGVNYTPGNEMISNQVDLNLSKDIGRWVVEVNSVFGGKSNDPSQAQSAPTYIGDINAEYKITDNLRLKAFNRSNANDFTKLAPYTQGVGIIYRKEYENFSDIFKFKRKQNKLNQSKDILR